MFTTVETMATSHAEKNRTISVRMLDFKELVCMYVISVLLGL